MAAGQEAWKALEAVIAETTPWPPPALPQPARARGGPPRQPQRRSRCPGSTCGGAQERPGRKQRSPGGGAGTAGVAWGAGRGSEKKRRRRARQPPLCCRPYRHPAVGCEQRWQVGELTRAESRRLDPRPPRQRRRRARSVRAVQRGCGYSHRRDCAAETALFQPQPAVGKCGLRRPLLLPPLLQTRPSRPPRPTHPVHGGVPGHRSGHAWTCSGHSSAHRRTSLGQGHVLIDAQRGRNRIVGRGPRAC